MDANRFDTLAKELIGTRSRRSALGAAIAGGVLSALGLGREAPAHAAQDDRCEVPGAGGTCVLDFEAILREGPSAGQPLVAGGSPGRLRGYLVFTQGRTGDLEDAKLFLDDGSSLPVSGLAIGQGFQARIDVGRGQALVAVGVGEPDFTRCLGRLDGTVTSTVVGDLGDWHALAGVQNIPGASGGSTQSTGSGNRPASNGSGSGIQLAQGNASTGSRTNGGTGGSGNPPVAATNGNQAGSNASGRGNGSSDGSSGSGSNGSNRPANDSGSSGSGGQTSTERDTVEERQETDGEAVLACPESQTRCGNNCVNLQVDASNCGQCGNACARSEDCDSGVCSAGDVACQEGETRCSNACVNTTRDVFNCGECGKVCALDEECSGGRCRAIEADDGNDGNDEEEPDAAGDPAACAQGQTRCGANCTDLQTDETNCGLCGTTCVAGEECVAGKCTPPASPLCPEGQVRCDGICKEALPNFGSEGISCPGGGAAPTECPAGRVLCNGACFPEGQCQPTDCAPGWGYCYGVCRDLQSDPGACGTCGTSCPGGICLNGACLTCPEGHMPCNGSCVNVQGDIEHCGFCNNRCGTQCIDGQCTAVGPTPGCSPGTTRCGNACVDLTQDSTNCGACGNVCGANSTCYPPGDCGFSAAYCESLGDQACGLGCVSRSDPSNCGGCGNVCPGGYACDPDLEICYIVGGSKRDGVKPTPRQSLAPSGQQTLVQTSDITCPPEQDECAGVCTDLSTDARNCGACGNACAADEDCLQGQCAASGSSTVGTSAEPDAAAPLPDAGAPASETTAETPGSPCAEGQVTCGGVCTDLGVDPLNCGDCGVNCGAGGTCDLGVCTQPIAPVEESLPVPDAASVGTDTPAGPIPTESEPLPEPELEPESVPESVPVEGQREAAP